MAELSKKSLEFATHTLLNLPGYKSRLITTCLEHKILTFGTYTLKSGRVSPYFFNAGSFHSARLLEPLSTAYAETIISQVERNGLEFDVVFGPAYKGIPLATLTCQKLGSIDIDRYGDVGLSFNRKEAKDHGEGGIIVGSPLKGKKVLIVDDVITSGKAINEGVEIIKKEGGTLVGIVVALDRMEKMPSENDEDGVPRPSAIGEVRSRYNVPVFSILTLDDIIDSLKKNATVDEVERLEAYRNKYRAVE